MKMGNSILNYTSEEDYLYYLKGLDENALQGEYYACYRLKNLIDARTDRVCRTVFNQFCTQLVDINHDDITRYDYYLIRILLRFELYIKRQAMKINELHSFYNPKPLYPKVSSASVTPHRVLDVYSEAIEKFQRLERIISAMEERTNMWLHFLYNRRSIPKEYDTEKWRQRLCAINDDGSFDFKYQLELVYKELSWIIETEMGCDILVFREQ